MNDINSLIDWLDNKFNKDLPINHLLNCAFLLNIAYFDQYNEYIVPNSFEMIDNQLTYIYEPDHQTQAPKPIQKGSDLDKTLHKLFVLCNLYEEPELVVKKILKRFPVYD